MYAKKTQSPSGDSASILQQFRNLKCWIKHLLGRVDCQQIQLAILWQLFGGKPVNSFTERSKLRTELNPLLLAASATVIWGF